MKYAIAHGGRRRQPKSRVISKYQYDRNVLPPIPMMYLASDPKPSAWNATIGWVFALGHLGTPASGYLNGRLAAGKAIDDQLLAVEYLADQESFGATTDFEKPFEPRFLPRPRSIEATKTRPEAWFEWSRVAGMNPTLLRRVESTQAIAMFGLDATRTGLLDELPGDSIDSLIAAERLFLVDHRWLSGITQQKLPLGEPKYAPPTAGLFYVDGEGRLRSLAVYLPHGQRRPEPGKGGADTYLADGTPAWRMARTFFEIADLNYHEIVSHLVYTHFCLEAVIVARARSLADSHPIGRLLLIHLQNVLFNNFEGRMLLINEGGFASKLLFGGTEGSKELIRLAYKGDAYQPGFSIDTWDLPADLARRGVGPGSKLEEYPYRDDGLRMWNAIETFVREYVHAWYPTDAAADDDPQVRQWLYELEVGAKIPGLDALFTRLGITEVRDKLVATVVRVIWASGPFHSALNFSQFDHAAYVPAMPGAAFARPLVAAHGATDPEIDAFLRGDVMPGPESTLLQLKTVSLLTAFRFDRFGRYPAAFVSKLVPAAKLAVERLGTELDAIEIAIVDANRARRFDYDYLRPSLVLNAASI